jgi:antitoxin component of MazEF toxin-antitoxin module
MEYARSAATTFVPLPISVRNAEQFRPRAFLIKIRKMPHSFSHFSSVQCTNQEKGIIMVKTLTRLGNSSALIIDKTLMELLGIDTDTPLKLTVEKRRLIVEAQPKSDRTDEFSAALKRVNKTHSATFKRLAR